VNVAGSAAIVTGGASGLGRASAARLAAAGAAVVIVDLPGAPGDEVAAALGERCRFAPADVTDGDALATAVAMAAELAPLRVLVHCAGRGGAVRILDRAGDPVALAPFEETVRVNLVGTFNVLRVVAAGMAATEPRDGERGVCVLTSSVAAYEGRIGQMAYAASKAGVVGMTLVAARDLASRLIRVCAIAPGVFDTPMLGRLPDEVRAGLAADVPHPRRLGDASEYAALALHIIENPMLNGETIRLDGALRMTPR
jgi:NAD(P)-dependent dehydrogenase (short-subunit alcohol dehydrogenase family)